MANRTEHLNEAGRWSRAASERLLGERIFQDERREASAVDPDVGTVIDEPGDRGEAPVRQRAQRKLLLAVPVAVDSHVQETVFTPFEHRPSRSGHSSEHSGTYLAARK